eukprot:TRINITY_DN669_c2_g1_i1.p1 TRINITY_DN669_c2_g1~~TRINITY_DN669_c2_g1_i1.p1  ORF type:complete len:264 (-),score=125.96 TRINITY_DN669_c2_g1_i1:748-1539(-)
MEKRIELERRGKDPSEITELNLDNSRATQIEGLTDEYANLSSLSLISVGLTTLKGFPSLPKLQKLELSENWIVSGLNALTGCPGITHLNLSNNRIKEIEALEPLKSFGSLTHLDLFNNDICKMEDYRSKVFKLIGSLKFLDGYDLEENEAEESDSDEGGANGVPASEDADEDLEDEDDIGDEEEDDLEEEEDDLEEEEEEDDDDGPGLASIYNTNFNDVEDGDYECNEDAEDVTLEDEDGEEDDEDSAPQEKRRKKNNDEGKS